MHFKIVAKTASRINKRQLLSGLATLKLDSLMGKKISLPCTGL